MENQSNSNQSNSNQDCCCGDGGCCTPPKSSIWKKIVFVVIVLAAGAIVTMKLVGNGDAPPAKCCEKPKGSCCSQSLKDSTNCTQPKSEY